MMITLKQARARLGALLDEIARSKTPVTIRRKGQPDIVLSPATDPPALQDAALTLFLTLLADDIEAHPERLNGPSRDLLARIAKLTVGVPIDHDAPIGAVTGLERDPVTPRQQPKRSAQASRAVTRGPEQAHPAPRSARKRPPRGNAR